MSWSAGLGGEGLAGEGEQGQAIRGLVEDTAVTQERRDHGRSSRDRGSPGRVKGLRVLWHGRSVSCRCVRVATEAGAIIFDQYDLRSIQVGAGVNDLAFVKRRQGAFFVGDSEVGIGASFPGLYD